MMTMIDPVETLKQEGLEKHKHNKDRSRRYTKDPTLTFRGKKYNF